MKHKDARPGEKEAHQLKTGWFHSVVTRLVLTLIVGGTLLVLGVGLLEVERAESLLRLQLGQRVSVATRNLQSLLNNTLEYQTREKVEQSLQAVTSDSYFLAVRVVDDDETISVGDWNTNAYTDVNVWRMPDHGFGFDFNVNWNRLTIVQAPFTLNDNRVRLEILVDGVTAWREMKSQVLSELRLQAMLTGAVLLFGLFLLRRWFTRPLSVIVGLIRAGAPPQSFIEASRHSPGEFNHLARSIGTMINDLSDTAEALKQREKAFSELYHFAPAAMLSVVPSGTIVNANRRAAALFGLGNEDDVVGQAIQSLIDPGSRAALEQSMHRLLFDNESHCELQLALKDRVADISVDLLAVREDDGSLDRIRLALIDVSQLKQLQRQLANKGRILNLVVEHMSDAILLVNEKGRVVAHNQKLLSILRLRSESIVGQWYDPEHFWDELNIENHDLFARQIVQIHNDHHRPAAERFIDHAQNALLFNSVPVHDDDGQYFGRLWVVQDMTLQDQHERLIQLQNDQLRAIRRLGHDLVEVRSLDELAQRTVQMLYDLLGVEMIGIALRGDDLKRRSKQIFDLGKATLPADTSRELADVIESSFMRHVLSGREAMYWSDLPEDQTWSEAFANAGATSVAAIPLRGSIDNLGMFWMGRRAGERLEPHHLYLLETLVPTLAARFELAIEHERLQQLELSDTVTDLPNRIQFEFQIRQITTHQQWAALIVSIDQLRRWNELIGHTKVNQLLARVAGELQAEVRRSCFLARIDGKSFAVLCPNLTKPIALAMAERILRMFNRLSAELEHATPLTASIGVAVSPVDGVDGQRVVSVAEDRASIARRLGGNQIVVDSAVSKAG